MSGCYDCGLSYQDPGWIEAIIPDNVWDFISPTKNQGGLLCITCISRRLSRLGIGRIPVWLCGTEPLRSKLGDPGDDIAFLRNWEPKRLKRIKNLSRDLSYDGEGWR